MFGNQSAAKKGLSPNAGSDVYTRTSASAETAFTAATKTLTQNAKVLSVSITAVGGPAIFQLGPFPDGRSVIKTAFPNQSEPLVVPLEGLPEFSGVIPSVTFGTELPVSGSQVVLVFDWLKPKA